MAGWSYGGMIARLFGQRFPAEVAGLLLVDSAHEDEFVRKFWLDSQPIWRDGAYPVDFDATRAQLLQATDLGSRPMIVLTQGDPTGELEREWAPIQDALAAMSSNSLHLVAAAAGHDINSDQPELVRAAARAVVDAVRSGGSLPACGPTFRPGRR